jgi:DNA-binding response OmpR family regulator
VDVVYNGTDGYDLASAENYGVIILDLMLPDMGDRNLPKSSGRKYSYPNTYVDS